MPPRGVNRNPPPKPEPNPPPQPGRFQRGHGAPAPPPPTSHVYVAPAPLQNRLPPSPPGNIARPAPAPKPLNAGVAVDRRLFLDQFGGDAAHKFFAHHAGMTPEGRQQDPIKTMYGAIGYVGNTTADFNAAVHRINTTFEDVMGSPPTPGAVLDLLRSPEAQDPNALRALLSSSKSAIQNVGSSLVGPEQGFLQEHAAGVLMPSQEAQLQEAEYHAGARAGLASALGIGAPGLVEAIGAKADEIHKLRETLGPEIQQQAVYHNALTGYLNSGGNPYQTQIVNGQPMQISMASMLPVSAAANFAGKYDVMREINNLSYTYFAYGLQPQQFTGVKNVAQTWQLVQQAMEASGMRPFTTGKEFDPNKAGLSLSPNFQFNITTTKQRIQTLANVQKQILSTYAQGRRYKDLNPNGVMTPAWIKFIGNLNSNRGYALQKVIQAGIDNGYFQGVNDPYNAINPVKGGFANTPDGQAAVKDMPHYLAAIKEQQKSGSWFDLRNFDSSDPLDYAKLAGGAIGLRNIVQSLPLKFFSHGGLTLEGGFGSFGSKNSIDPLNGAALIGMPGNIFSTAEQDFPKSVTLGMNTAGGILGAGITDAQMAESFIPLNAGPKFHNVNGTANQYFKDSWAEAVKRYTANRPDVIAAAVNSPEWAQQHIPAEQLLNFLAQIAIFHKLGELRTGTGLDAADLARGAVFHQSGDEAGLWKWASKQAGFKAVVKDAYGYAAKGNMGKALETIRSMRPGTFWHEKRFLLGEDGSWARAEKVVRDALPSAPVVDGEAIPIHSIEPDKATTIDTPAVRAADAARQLHEAVKLQTTSGKELVSLAELFDRGLVDRPQFGAEMAHSFAWEHGVLDEGLYNMPTRPYLPFYRAPLSATFRNVGDLIRFSADHAEAMLHNDVNPGAGYAGRLERYIRVTRVMLSKDANWRYQAADVMPIDNIYRLARKGGATPDLARSWENRFAKALAQHDHPEFVQVEEEIRKFARDNGWKRAEREGVDKVMGHWQDANGEMQYSSQHQFLMEELEKTPKEITVDGGVEANPDYLRIQELLDSASKEPGAVMETQEPYWVQFPELAGGDSMPARLQANLNKIGQVERRLILTADPILFAKHGIDDTLRRQIAEGGPWTYAKNKVGGAVGQLHQDLAENPTLSGKWDTAYQQAKYSELHWALRNEDQLLRGETVEPHIFNTSDFFNHGVYRRGFIGEKVANAHIGAAADMIHQRLLSGAYQAWRDAQGWAGGGAQALTDWFMHDPAGIRLAAKERFPPDFMAQMLDRQLTTLHNEDPTFMDDAAEAVKGSKNARLSIAKLIVKEERKFTVSGHVPSDRVYNLAWRFNKVTDNISGSIVARYMSANKWNRGGLFQDLTAERYRALRKAGVPMEPALNAAIATARVVNRYHMLDLADALGIENTFRAFAMFTTKHRLYWQYLAKMVAGRPDLVIAFEGLRKAYDIYEQNYHKNNPGQGGPQGNVDIHLGGGTWHIPLARILWMSQSDQNPGPIADFAMNGVWNGVNDFGKVDALGNGGWEITPIDTWLRVLAVNYWGEAHGHQMSSNDMIAQLSPTEAYKFKEIYARVQFGYQMQHHGQSMTDQQATAVARQHFIVSGVWQQLGPLGYSTTNMSSNFNTQYPAKWMKAYATYHQITDPAEREAWRKSHPYLDVMLGVYSTTPDQKAKTTRFFAAYNRITKILNNRQNAILQEANKTGDMALLFEKPWKEASAQYSNAIDALQAQAGAVGASDFLTIAFGDRTMQDHQQFSGFLHQMYPNVPVGKLNALTTAAEPPQMREWNSQIYGANAPFSDANIKKLPVSYQVAAHDMQTYYRDQIIQFKGVTPHNAASAIRDQYFQKYYVPYFNKYGDFFKGIDTSTKFDQQHQFDNMRAWQDQQDKPIQLTYKGQSYTMPSPIRIWWAMKTPEKQRNELFKWGVSKWQWLSRFQKQQMGVSVAPSTQAGWTYYNNLVYNQTTGYEKQTGKTPSLGAPQLLQFAWNMSYNPKAAGLKTGTSPYPNFYYDYVRGLIPPIFHFAGMQFGGTPGARKAWRDFVIGTDASGKVTNPHSIMQAMVWAAGPPPIAPAATLAASPAKLNNLITWGKVLGTQEWTNLVNVGRNGVANSLPFGALPNSPNAPNGGFFYQEAMKYKDPVFKQELRYLIFGDQGQGLAGDPNWLTQILTYH